MTFAKALIVPAVGVIIYLLSMVGVTEGMTVMDAVTTLVTALAVYMVPNAKV